MSRNQGADELRVRALLRQNGVGPNPIPPKPTSRPRDWLDDILNSPPPRPAAPAAPPPAPPATAPEPPQITTAKPKKKRKKPSPSAPRTAFDTQINDPRQSLLDAWQHIPPRLKWLGHHTTAAAAGWPLGWVAWGTDTAAWFAAGHAISPSAFALYALGACALSLDRRSRAWAWPIAWAAAIPVSSVTVGVLLYGTGYHP